MLCGNKTKNKPNYWCFIYNNSNINNKFLTCFVYKLRYDKRSISAKNVNAQQSNGSQLSHIVLEQFPTLNFIVERAEKIRNYQPEEFFYLEIKVKKKDKNGENIVTFNWERNRIF